MINARVPTIERLRAGLDLDASQGILRYRFRGSATRTDKAFNARNGGKIACRYIDKNGYARLKLDGFIMSAHRAVFAHFYGHWPEHEIDHINGDRTDNRIVNLREATRAENNRNCGLNVVNTSGHIGVRQSPNGKWLAAIKFQKKRFHIGSFSTIEDAVEAYARVAAELGFHSNHGARPSLNRKRLADQASAPSPNLPTAPVVMGPIFGLTTGEARTATLAGGYPLFPPAAFGKL